MIVNIWLNEKYSIYSTLNICLTIFILVLLKDVGLFLAIMGFVVLLIDIVVKIKNNDITIKNGLALMVLNIITILYAKLSWSYEIAINSVTSNFPGKVDLTVLVKVLLFQDNTYRRSVFINFINNLAGNAIITDFINLDVIRLTVIFVAIYMILYIRIIKCKKFVMISLLSGLIIYTFGMLVTYLFKFSEYEAGCLASFSRYFSIYFIAILCIIVFYILYINNNKYLAILLCCLILFAPLTSVTSLLGAKSDSISYRNTYSEGSVKILNYLDNKEKVYIVSQNSAGYDYWMLRYVLYPIKVNEIYTWSLGDKYNDNDIYTKNITADEWIKDLNSNNFNYVYIVKCDYKFKSKFKTAFLNIGDISDNTLYKVNSENRLEKVN